MERRQRREKREGNPADFLFNLIGSSDIDEEMRSKFDFFASKEFVLGNMTPEQCREAVEDLESTMDLETMTKPGWAFGALGF